MSANNTDERSQQSDDPVSGTLQFTGSDRSLSTEIVMRVASASGIDPTQLHEALYEVINPSALDALFQPKADGTTRSHGTVCFSFHGYRVSVEDGGTITLQSELDRLKQTGVNLLVCGAVPDAVRDEMSARLLGDAARDRTAVFVLSDRPEQTALHRLSDARIPEHRAHVLSTGDLARSARPTANADVTMSSISGALNDVESAVIQTLSGLERRNDGFAPSELRFCFDSLRPFIETVDREQFTTVLSRLCEAIKQRDGMGQYLLPYSFESAPIQTIRSLFDVVVEVRVGKQGPKYRWHLQTTEFTTRWMSL